MSQKFTCLGKKITAKEQRDDLEQKRKAHLSRMEELETDTDDVQQNAINDSVKNSISAKIKHLDNQIESLAKKNDDVIVGRMACGYDLTKIVEAFPLDGEDYTAQCPACHNEFNFKRPTK